MVSRWVHLLGTHRYCPSQWHTNTSFFIQARPATKRGPSWPRSWCLRFKQTENCMQAKCTWDATPHYSPNVGRCLHLGQCIQLRSRNRLSVLVTGHLRLLWATPVVQRVLQTSNVCKRCPRFMLRGVTLLVSEGKRHHKGPTLDFYWWVMDLGEENQYLLVTGRLKMTSNFSTTRTAIKNCH